jgi:nitrite reductase/ring-hydroxylating ferredoxin subunit
VGYLRGEQVALFNADGRIYAVGSRCSHANGPLADVFNFVAVQHVLGHLADITGKAP